MVESSTNNLGKGITALGMFVFVCSVLAGFKGGFHLFDQGPLIGMAVAIGITAVGMYVRVVGNILVYIGIVIIVLAILHLFLAGWVGIDALYFGLKDRAEVVVADIFCIIGAVALILVGALLARNEKEEASDGARAKASAEEQYANRRIQCARDGCGWEGRRHSWDEAGACPSCRNETYYNR